PRWRGRAFLIRYADEFRRGFAGEADARRVLEVLPKRLARYGLTIHPDKTRLVPFRPPSGSDRADSTGQTQPGTVDLLGFTHYGGRSRKGVWVVKRRTAAGRFRRALRMLAGWCRCNRHRPLAAQHRTLSQK